MVWCFQCIILFLLKVRSLRILDTIYVWGFALTQNAFGKSYIYTLPCHQWMQHIEKYSESCMLPVTKKIKTQSNFRDVVNFVVYCLAHQNFLFLSKTKELFVSSALHIPQKPDKPCFGLHTCAAQWDGRFPSPCVLDIRPNTQAELNQQLLRKALGLW